MNLKDYERASADWRKIIRTNTHRTYFVITSFILIYTGIGLLVDIYFNSHKYPTASLATISRALADFEIFPTATLLLFIVAIVAIAITFLWHDRLMLLGTEYHEITPQTARTTQETQLYNVIEEMKISAGLHFMPKVYIIEANYMNAFASGYSEKSAMVAITRGLISKLNRAELQAVMAHELSHIRHLDIKLTLMAAVLANITLIVIDILFRGMIFTGGGEERNNKSRGGIFAIVMIIRFVLPLVTVLLILYLSRTREYMADAGSVELMRDNHPLASALLKINNDHTDNAEQYAYDYQSTPHESVRKDAYIFDPTQAGICSMQSLTDVFATHPSIKNRLAALGFKSKLS
jgi:heat shock protein HtpX